ncbi:MAG TPA: ATP synthase F0 subunit B [Sandaracinaceae bacterium]
MKRRTSIALLLAALLAPSLAAAQGPLEPGPNPFAAERRRPRPAAAEPSAPAEPAPAEEAAAPEALEPEAATETLEVEESEALGMEAAPLEPEAAQLDALEADAREPGVPEAEAETLEAEAAQPEVLEATAAAQPPAEEHVSPAAEHAEHANEHHGFDWMGFLPTVVNFLILLAILTWLLRKPLMTFLENRRLAVLEGLEEARRLKEAAEKKFQEYSERLAHLDEELAKLRQEMVQAGETERDRIIAEAEARAARMRKDAQFVIDQQMKQLRADLTREAIEAAIAAAEKALAEQTSAADQQRLAEAYLRELTDSIKKDEVRA